LVTVLTKKTFNACDSIAIIHNPSEHILEEVLVKAKAMKIRIAKDMVEYNTHAYYRHPNDRVAELLKQLPGVTVGPDGASVIGRPLVN
jgi:hypothetical protein